ncbi:hypothetical protein HanIR_Chr01g0011021 [Helianthus annuus]|nr:hypothetical protein HanIR_Chr01g0011021 [Helianthus annuus]
MQTLFEARQDPTVLDVPLLNFLTNFRDSCLLLWFDHLFVDGGSYKIATWPPNASIEFAKSGSQISHPDPK